MIISELSALSDSTVQSVGRSECYEVSTTSEMKMTNC